VARVSLTDTDGRKHHVNPEHIVNICDYEHPTPIDGEPPTPRHMGRAVVHLVHGGYVIVNGWDSPDEPAKGRGKRPVMKDGRPLTGPDGKPLLSEFEFELSPADVVDYRIREVEMSARQREVYQLELPVIAAHTKARDDIETTRAVAELAGRMS
jgi:hypothetical protein